ncbi:MAG: UvrD-helicase domain-containing protein [Oscillospiraceae bacterium]|jgi:DNA helicase-2/ATP-dependent DNA helicase PcrA|nr:UvrD-helicase domain-containing protein [Oscillospiraceae bacterium]
MEPSNSLKTDLIKHYFSDMNTQQQAAIGNLTGPVLILAGAGSGKTTVIVNRIRNMIKYGIDFNFVAPDHVNEATLEQLKNKDAENIDWVSYDGILGKQVKSWNILAITFTNKAAMELKERLKQTVGEAADSVNAGTFHWLCLRILRNHIDETGLNRGFTIYDTDDSKKLIKRIFKARGVNEETFSVNLVLAEIGRAKDNLLTPDAYQSAVAESYRKSIIAEIYKTYQAELRAGNAVDFDDIIMLAVSLLRQNTEVLTRYQNRFSHIMVDEYQDTNYAQFVLVQLLAKEHGNLCVVGDDDQSIYRFRGADIDNILNFEKHFKGAKLIRLEQNYRSTQNILAAANAVIANNPSRKGKKLWTQNEEGSKVEIFKAEDEHREAIYIAEKIRGIIKQNGKYSNCAVLYRMNAQSNVIEAIFSKKSLPYRIFGGLKFYERKEIKDILAYLNVIVNRNDEIRLLRIINEPKRKIGTKAIATLYEIKQSEGKSLFEAIETATESRQLQGFAALICELKNDLETTNLPDFIDVLMEKTGYRDMLRKAGLEGMSKLENISELKSNLLIYSETEENPTLEGFLNDIAISEDLKDPETDTDCVNLMTLHAAKGLEFENVFIVGMEDGIFPGNKVFFDEKELEEERRLAYVGFTRAKKRLFLVRAGRRTYLGKTSFNKPSRFLKEVPEDLCEIHLDEKPTNLVRQKKQVRRSGYVGYIKSEMSSRHNGPKFAGGEVVRHPKFGLGRVKKVNSSGNDQLLEIEFEGVGIKRLMANYTNLVID